MTDLEDAELDQLLERFDQTEPSLQRKIVGRLMLNIAALEAQRDELAQHLWAVLDLGAGCDDCCKSYENWTDTTEAAEAALSKVPKKLTEN